MITETPCEICGKPISWLIYSSDTYIYKRVKKGKTYYFCGYNCRKRWDERKGGKKWAN